MPVVFENGAKVAWFGISDDVGDVGYGDVRMDKIIFCHFNSHFHDHLLKAITV